MNKSLKIRWLFVLILVLAVATRFWHLSRPPEVVFDEVHFGKFVAGYFSGEYFFDIHPPTAKLMIAGFAKLAGVKPEATFHRIGEAYNARDLFILRFLPALFGSLLVALIYLVIIELGMSEKAALFGASLILLDNAFLTQSKFILMDSILLSFGVAALYAFLLARRRNGTADFLLFALTGIFAGLAVGVKYTGIAFTAIIFLAIAIELIKTWQFKKYIFGSLLIAIFAAIAFAMPFYIHFELLSHSGPGDAFMSSVFRSGLVGNKFYSEDAPRMSFFDKFTELNKEMYSASSRLTATHPDGSVWHEWLRGKKPIFYWTKKVDGGTASIYLTGNPVILGAILIGVLGAPFLLFNKKIRRRLQPAIYIVLFGYFINLLPFLFITRVAFLYHYLPSMVFGILTIATMGDFFFFNARGRQTLLKKWLPVGFVALAAAAFIYLAPTSYGFIAPWQPSLQSFIMSRHE